MVTTPATWKMQHQVNLSDPDEQQFPDVINIGNGRFLAVWEEDLGGPIATDPGDDIVGQIYDALGNPIGTEFQLNQAWFSDNERDPALAERLGGGFAVVYEDDGEGAIRIETYDVDGNVVPGLPTTIADGPFPLLNPAIDMAADGSYLVAYQRNNAGDNDILATIVDANGNVGAPFIVYDDTEDSNNPSVAALSNGNFVVAYVDEDAGASEDRDVQFNIVTPGSPPTVSSPETTISGGATNQTQVQVAALKNGGFVAVYRDAVNGGDVFAAIYDNAGNVVKAPFLVHDDTTGSQEQPDVAALDDGGFAVVWNDETLDVVNGQRFDANGNKVGDQFIAGSFGNTENPTIGALGDGRFFVGYQQTTGDDDVWGTIFDPREKSVKGTSDDDVLTAFATGGKVKGKGGDDYLLGTSSNDNLIGGGGKDWLFGLDGDDILKGGGQKDKLGFVTALDKKTNVDTVQDFKKKGKDKIFLLDDIFPAIGDKLNKGEFEIGKNADDGNDYIIAKIKENKGKALLYYDEDGDGSGKKVKFAKLEFKDDDFELKHKDFKVLDDFVI